jgi:hypothetical protein
MTRRYSKREHVNLQDDGLEPIDRARSVRPVDDHRALRARPSRKDDRGCINAFETLFVFKYPRDVAVLRLRGIGLA